MPVVPIQKISLDTNGHLYVQPTGSSYAYIWRDASSVQWDESTSELYVLEVRGFDALAEFKQIIKAVRGEYFDELELSPTTQFEGVPVELIATLRAWAELQRNVSSSASTDDSAHD